MSEVTWKSVGQLRHHAPKRCTHRISKQKYFCHSVFLASAAPQAVAVLRGKTTMTASILVVEDESAIQELIAINLGHAGNDVTWAADAETALSMVNSELPDMVLIDWVLPGMSGVALTRQRRQDERTRSLPILMLTARSDEQ